MNEKLYETLEICLKTLERGADPEPILERFPEMKNELLPLLGAARQARRLAVPAVPDEVLRRNKARLLGHAAGMRASAQRTQKHRSMFIFPRLAVSLAIALLFMFSGTGLVRASNGALPGDSLYPVKRTWEDVRLLLVFNPESRESLEDEFEQERLHEVDELIAEGRDETIKFAGVVTEQNGNQWVVSGVRVQITPESKLPAIPVTIGTSVVLEGRTNAQGFVEAYSVEILGLNLVLPTSVPTQIDTYEDLSDSNDSSFEGNDNSHQDEADLESSKDENLKDGGEKDDHSDIPSDSQGENTEDQRKEYHSGKGGEDQINSSGSGGGQKDSEDGGHD